MSYRVDNGVFSLYDSKITTLDGIEIPEDIVQISVSFTNINTLDNVRFPETVKYFYFNRNDLKSLDNVKLPDGLDLLNLANNMLTSLDDVQFPQNLRILTLLRNRLTSLANVQFPESLEVLYLECNNFECFDGLYISPATHIQLYQEARCEIRKAVRATCTQAIFKTPPLNPITLGAWWARVSYLTGGVTYLVFDGAL